MHWISPNIVLGDNMDGMQPAGRDVLPNVAADDIVEHDLDHLHLKIGDRAPFLTGSSTKRSGIFWKT
jgi:hypothetical protein